jgi:hypothetical protein
LSTDCSVSTALNFDQKNVFVAQRLSVAPHFDQKFVFVARSLFTMPHFIRKLAFVARHFLVNFIYIPSVPKYVFYFHNRLESGAESADFLTSFQRGKQTSRNQIGKTPEMQREIDGPRNQIEKIPKMQRGYKRPNRMPA